MRDVVQRQGKNQPAAKEDTDEQIKNDHRVAKKLAADLKAHDEAEASKGAKQEDNDTAFTPVTSRKRGKGKGKAPTARQQLPLLIEKEVAKPLKITRKHLPRRQQRRRQKLLRTHHPSRRGRLVGEAAGQACWKI